ncbi:hypothetical protein B0I35DRAFT_124978 [Stachybotrys elegans]|uniref:Uncharacterized protein n=1 Tax=Stachybotrys elegans TaxID=80388 RepID=A0A8K0WUW8_9HYPO|nr:hypothetical protein B0I35DRAFT_124978 [Stachybotrys elegans]
MGQIKTANGRRPDAHKRLHSASAQLLEFGTYEKLHGSPAASVCPPQSPFSNPLSMAPDCPGMVLRVTAARASQSTPPPRLRYRPPGWSVTSEKVGAFDPFVGAEWSDRQGYRQCWQHCYLPTYARPTTLGDNQFSTATSCSAPSRAGPKYHYISGMRWRMALLDVLLARTVLAPQHRFDASTLALTLTLRRVWRDVAWRGGGSTLPWQHQMASR